MPDDHARSADPERSTKRSFLDWRWVAGGALFLACASFAAPAQACPSCPVGQEARRQVWRDRFLDNLAVTVLPFAIIGAVCARVQNIGRPRQDRS